MNLLSSSLTTAVAAFGLAAPPLCAQPGTFATYGAGCPSASATDLSLGDDDVARAVPLGFNFPYAGGVGSTRAVDVSSNGYVYLEPGTIATSRCCAPSLQRFAADAPSIAIFGNDLDPSAAGAVLFETDGSTTATITWLGVPEFGSVAQPYDLQARLSIDGSFELSYRNSAPQAINDALVGYSPGGGATNAGMFDLSIPAFGLPAGNLIFELFPPVTGWDLNNATLTFVPNVAGSYDVIPGPLRFALPMFPVTIRSDCAPNLGRTMLISLDDLPATSTSAALMLGVTPVNVPLDTVGMPGCSLLVDNVFATPAGVIRGSRADFAIPIFNNPGSLGIQIFAQGTVVSPGANPLGIVASNRGTLTIGSDPALVAIAEGQSSGIGNPAAGGYFRLAYLGQGSANRPRILSATWDLSTATAGRLDFDTDGLTGSRQFHFGNGNQAGCDNTFYGSDVTTGLIYGSPGQRASGCDPAGFTGWVGRNPGIGMGFFASVSFSFASFDAGETFAFDCDTDFPFPNNALSHAGGTVTVTFSDGARVSGRLTARPTGARVETILVP